MSWLADLPFQRKLRFAILSTTAVAVLLACGVFIAFEYVGSQRSLMRTVTTLARSAADNTTAAIAFGDPERARQTLESLRAEPQIVAAALCNTEGEVIAGYSANPDIKLPPLPPRETGVRIIGDRVVGVEPVIQGNRWLGTLYVWASMERLNDRMHVYGLVVLTVLATTSVLAWVLSSVLRSTIARPILELANTAGAIAAGQDYSLRARQYRSDELGRLTAAFNAMLDRTQEAVSALRVSEAQLRLVTDNASVFLTHCDRDHRFKFVNRPYAARFGLEPAQVIGRTVADVLGPAAFQVIHPHMVAVLTGQRVEFEAELNYQRIGRRWMHVVYEPERTTDGAVIGFVGIISDISPRKQVEQEVARARDEALAASRAKDDFLAALSHELRTPLNPVLLLASEAAQDPRLPGDVREDFETIRKHVELEARLIDDLLDLTAITRGKLSLERKRTDLHFVLRDAIATVSADMAEKHIRLVPHTASDRAEVIGDPVRLQQVFWNVLKNAVKFTPAGGRIEVETSIAEGRVLLRVSDTGIGLTPGELERIFDAFSQGDHASEGGSHVFGGLGLGLTISRMVIERHGGKIQASSAGRGQGASFLIELPQASASDRVDTCADASLLAGPAAPIANGLCPGQILLVEDHAATRTALERLLVRRQYRVCSAGTLADARALADTKQFDLLISDVGLPDGNGYDLMQEIGTRFGMKGIALTGYGMEQDLARSKEAGFSAHLTKPVRVQALDAALADLLGRHGSV